MSCGSSNAACTAALAVVCLCAAPLARAAGVFAQPASMYLSAEAGADLAGEVSLSPTAETALVSISLSPFTIDEHGQPRTCECGLERSIRAWGDVSEHQLALTPGRRDTVTLHLSVPSSARGSYWGAVMVEVEDGLQGGMRIRSRIAVPVFVTIRGSGHARIDVSDLKAFKTAQGDVVVDGTLTNSGNVVVRAPLALAVETGPASEPVEMAAIDDAVVVVLPDGRRNFRLTMKGNFGVPSQLRVTAFFRYGSDPSELAERSCVVAAAQPCDSAACRGI